LKGWIEGPNALRWRLDRNYVAPLPRQSREKLRTPHGSTTLEAGSNPPKSVTQQSLGQWNSSTSMAKFLFSTTLALAALWLS
jgi:hypothetical protein